MLASTGDAQCEMLTIIVTNAYTTNAPSRASVTLAADATLAALHESVAGAVGFVQGTFVLHRNQDDELIVYALNDGISQSTTLAEAGIANKCRVRISVTSDGSFPTPVDTSGSDVAAAALGTVALWSASRGQSSAVSGPLSRGGAGLSAAQPNADGFVGLLNQGATCYLSSLVQSLFMTHEFRKALYGLGPPCSPEDASAPGDAASASSGGGSGFGSGAICRELQRLFVQMQTADSRAVSTVGLTRSFGWTSSDSFQQHDVQEFLRVLFDALESELKGTEHADTLKDIYRGESCDFVQCKACQHASSSVVPFDDVNLAICAFDETQTPIRSLEAALSAFLEPETLVSK